MTSGCPIILLHTFSSKPKLHLTALFYLNIYVLFQTNLHGQFLSIKVKALKFLFSDSLRLSPETMNNSVEVLGTGEKGLIVPVKKFNKFLSQHPVHFIKTHS